MSGNQARDPCSQILRAKGEAAEGGMIEVSFRKNVKGPLPPLLETNLAGPINTHLASYLYLVT